MRNIIIKSYLLISIFILLIVGCNTNTQFKPIVLKFEQDETVTYYEAIDIYKKLDKQFKIAKLFEYGNTDVGIPLHLFVISKNKDFNPESIKKKNKRIILINNGIHPGEPCGIDASIKFADEILRNENGLAKILDNTVICIIPVYSIGGALNRSAFNRANQDSPKECGFRGNGRNIDLNRDFAKLDSKNAQTFAQIFHIWKPDVFLDTHTTNGSDHQYAITLIPAQHNSLDPALDKFFDKEMVPSLYKKMKESPYEMIPYINYIYDDPKGGIASYVASPRFSAGFTKLFNTLSFLTENHIYKPFKDRVLSVYHFIIALAEYTNNNSGRIAELRLKANKNVIEQQEFVLTWELDTTISKLVNFKGYEAKYKTSLVTGLPQFYYDRNDPYETEIKFYDNFKPLLTVKKPAIYILPQAWQRTIDRLQLNNVEMKRLSKDTILTVQVYYITDFTTTNRPYNGHFKHNDVETRTEIQEIQYYKGDYVIEMNQLANRFIVEMLEPKAIDSYFKWNFFDSSLERREYFSSYTFVEKAMKYLEEIPGLKEEFEQEKKNNPELANDNYAQLRFIYMHSPYAEKTYKRYPVARINEWMHLPVE